MKVLEIFGENKYPEYDEVREGCRGIVINDGKILLSYEKNIDQYMIPGGGLEEGESLAECCIRELKEECGVVVSPSELFLRLEEYYKNCFFKSNYFLCEAKGECETSLTEAEKAEGLEPMWVALDEAIKIFGSYEQYKSINPMRYGMYFREHLALMEIQNLKLI